MNNQPLDLASQAAAILDLLEQQQTVIADLLQIAREKSLVICRGDAAELDRLVQAENGQREQAERLENERFRLAETVTSAFLMPQDRLSLEIWPGLTGVQQARLQQTGQQLRSTLAELQIVNQANRHLLETQLHITRTILDKMTHSTPATAYSADGNRASRQNQALNLFNEWL